jgi:hypothetical protein
MLKMFVIHILYSLTITSSFTINYQHLSVLIRHVFNLPVLHADWITTDMKADSVELLVNRRYRISGNYRTCRKPILFCIVWSRRFEFNLIFNRILHQPNCTWVPFPNCIYQSCLQSQEVCNKNSEIPSMCALILWLMKPRGLMPYL